MNVELISLFGKVLKEESDDETLNVLCDRINFSKINIESSMVKSILI